MKSFVRFGFFAFLGIILIGTAGCSSTKKQQQKQINSLNAQVGVLTDEVVRLDEAMQDVRSSNQAVQVQQSAIRTQPRTPSGATVAVGSVYRTPSGFELPALSIQQALKNAGYYRGPLDGKIGPSSKEAVKAFQRDHSLTADGVVGRGTWSKLKVYLGGAIK